MLVLDGTQREGRVWVARLTLSTALLLGLFATGLSVLILLSCQHPRLSWLYFLRLRDNAGSNEARFGFFGVCTVGQDRTACYRVDFASTTTNLTEFLSNTALTAERRLQPIFTPLLLISMILITLSNLIMLIYRVGPMLLPYKISTAIRSQKAILATLTLVCAWLSYLLAWIAAGIIQQVTTVLSIVAGSSFDKAHAQYTFSAGTVALAMQWGVAALVTLHAIFVTCNLLGLGTLRKEYEAGPIIVERKGPCCDWGDVQKSWFEVAGKTTGPRDSVMYWI